MMRKKDLVAADAQSAALVCFFTRNIIRDVDGTDADGAALGGNIRCRFSVDDVVLQLEPCDVSERCEHRDDLQANKVIR